MLLIGLGFQCVGIFFWCAFYDVFQTTNTFKVHNILATIFFFWRFVKFLMFIIYVLIVLVFFYLTVDCIIYSFNFVLYSVLLSNNLVLNEKSLEFIFISH